MNATINDIPLEILHLIAKRGVYRELLAVPRFARSVDISSRVDDMIMNGYGVTITSRKIIWTKNGKIHRSDGPAVESIDGGCKWYRNGLPHRRDGPAEITSTGKMLYYIDGYFVMPYAIPPSDAPPPLRPAPATTCNII